MNADQLLKHFDRISEAPDAVPRLRRFVLDLAVRGKLVEQDPGNEPAGELLKRIEREKENLTGRHRGAGVGIAGSENGDFPFRIPSRWAWVWATWPAELLSDKGRKIKTKDVLESGRFPVVDQGKVFIRGYCNDPEKVLRVKQPVIVFGDHTRETKLVDFDFVVGADGVKILRPIIVDPVYYYRALCWLPLESRGYGRHFKLLRASMVPLPPLPEQHRIVTKVDELMALCDELEAAQTTREDRRDRLVAATLHRLNNPDTEPESGPTFKQTAGFYLNHLPRLTTKPEHIQQLRQTILNLAVRGKLVPQDPGDEPAEELQMEMAKRANELLEKGEIRGIKPAEPIPDHETPFDCPSSWCWVRLQSIGITQTGNTPPKSHPEYFGEFIPFVKPAALTMSEIDYGGEGISREGLPFARRIRAGSVLMVCIGSSIGKVNRTDRDICCNQQINAVTPYLAGCGSYLTLALKADAFQRQITAKAGTGTLPIISKGKWERLIIPLPPFSEQKRIVEKAAAIFSVCERICSEEALIAKANGRVCETVLWEIFENAVQC